MNRGAEKVSKTARPVKSISHPFDFKEFEQAQEQKVEELSYGKQIFLLRRLEIDRENDEDRRPFFY